jgi:hypothetical protein
VLLERSREGGLGGDETGSEEMLRKAVLPMEETIKDVKSSSAVGASWLVTEHWRSLEEANMTME